MEIEAQDYINAITTLRNALADELAKAHAYIAKLERKLATEPAGPPPEAAP